MTANLERKVLTTSRLMEFFTEKELNMQIGFDKESWPIALLKELIDNALDASKNPRINIVVEDGFFSVSDNGPGLKESIITKSLDYSIRVSDKSAYVSPSRGQLGNALKCVWAAPFVFDGESGRVVIETGGKLHKITVTLDRINQTPVINHEIEKGSFVQNGTFIKVYWADVASYLKNLENVDLYNPEGLIDRYSLFNPHAEFTLNDEYIAPNGALENWTSDKPTSPHWYTVERLKTLIASYVSAGEPVTVREFVSEFRGLATSAKQKLVTDTAGLTGQSLDDMVSNHDINGDQVLRLLAAMQNHSQPVKPKMLGVIGKEVFFDNLMKFTEPAGTKYKMIHGTTVESVPFVIEVGFCYSTANIRRYTAYGINWTPLLVNPFIYVDQYLNRFRCNHYDPCVVIIHVTSPKIEFTDRGKSRAALPDEIEGALWKALETVTIDWVKLKRKSDKDDRMTRKALDDTEKAERKKNVTVKDAAYQVMEKAYLKASSNGTLPANARQIMYAARGDIIKITGKKKPWANSATFTGGSLA